MSAMSHVRTERATAPGGAYSQGVVYGQLVMTAGQVGRDPASGALPPDLESQIRLGVRNLQAVLEASGSSLANVLKTTCYLADIASFAAFDRVYAELFPEPRPVRSTVGVALADGLLFEIEAIAVRNDE